MNFLYAHLYYPFVFEGLLSAFLHVKYANIPFVPSVSNLGGTFPRLPVLKLVDYFTTATCLPPLQPTKVNSTLKGPLITAAFSCAAESEKHRCANGGGTCNIERDGYYTTNLICIALGVITFFLYIRPAALKLQSLPISAWRLAVSRGRHGEPVVMG